MFFPSPPHHGTLRRYYNHPSASLHALPDKLRFGEGSLLEPLSVALAGINRSNLRLGDPLVIAGAGLIVLLTLLMAHAAGVAPMVISGIESGRLEFAKFLVLCEKTVSIGKSQGLREVAGNHEKASLRGKAGLRVHCSRKWHPCRDLRKAYSLNNTLPINMPTMLVSQVTLFGGSMSVIGVAKETQNTPPKHRSSREIDLCFQYRYHDTCPKAISLVFEGLIGLKSLVTHRYGLEDGLAAFNAAPGLAAKAVKVQVLKD